MAQKRSKLIKNIYSKNYYKEDDVTKVAEKTKKQAVSDIKERAAHREALKSDTGRKEETDTHNQEDIKSHDNVIRDAADARHQAADDNAAVKYGLETPEKRAKADKSQELAYKMSASEGEVPSGDPNDPTYRNLVTMYNKYRAGPDIDLPPVTDPQRLPKGTKMEFQARMRTVAAALEGAADGLDEGLTGVRGPVTSAIQTLERIVEDLAAREDGR